jgi:aminoacrylate hydrolase
MIRVGLQTRIGSRAQRRRAFLRMVMPPELLAASDWDKLAETLGPFFGHDLAGQPPVVMKQLSAMRLYESVGRLTDLKGIPTLVVTAAHDRIARPEFGHAIASAIPGAKYIELANAAHGAPLHSPALISGILSEWLASVR